MKLVRTFRDAIWDARFADRAASYLRSRGFKDATVSRGAGGLAVAGGRGSWLGNLFSYDMTKLRARVWLSADDRGLVTAELEVEIGGQQITHWNMAVWRLELVELGRILSGKGRIDDVWERFNQEGRRASVVWTFTLMFGGQSLSDAWARELEVLERDVCLEERP